MKSEISLKTLALLPLIGGTFLTANAESPLLNLGDGVNAYFLGDAGVVYRSNL